MAKHKAYKPKMKLRKPISVRKAQGESLWDLDRDGVTYSMLSKFLVCRERTRLSYVEGWSETGLQAGMEFGSAFHFALESSPSPPEKSTQQYQRDRLLRGKLYGPQLDEFEKLMCMVEAVYYGYQEIWAKEHESMIWVEREAAFRQSYTLDMLDGTHRVVPLRGRRDGMYRDSRDDNRLWLFETKTKSDIDEDGLQRTLSQDLQTMLYVTTAELDYAESVSGVMYNVIRRPGMRPRKDEQLQDFRKRVIEDVRDRPNWYFYRWSIQLVAEDIKIWKSHTLDPLLRSIVQWWDSIKANPFEPWTSPYHFQRPFGVYDGLAAGRRGDYFELLTSGRQSGLERRASVFPELEED